MGIEAPPIVPMGGVILKNNFFGDKNLLLTALKTLIRLDFSKSYNYTPTMSNVHKDSEHSGDRSNRKIAPIFFFTQSFL